MLRLLQLQYYHNCNYKDNYKCNNDYYYDDDCDYLLLSSCCCFECTTTTTTTMQCDGDRLPGSVLAATLMWR